jgi:hypothetical protein
MGERRCGLRRVLRRADNAGMRFLHRFRLPARAAGRSRRPPR